LLPIFNQPQTNLHKLPRPNIALRISYITARWGCDTILLMPEVHVDRFVQKQNDGGGQQRKS
jgi:hypothetical protein